MTATEKYEVETTITNDEKVSFMTRLSDTFAREWQTQGLGGLTIKQEGRKLSVHTTISRNNEVWDGEIAKYGSVACALIYKIQEIMSACGYDENGYLIQPTTIERI